jgi:hypothetical protein
MRIDERLAAHLDGLMVAGDQVQPIYDALLAEPAPGDVFWMSLIALISGRHGALLHLLTSVASNHALRSGLLAAFGWVGRKHLRSVVAELLRSEDPLRRAIGPGLRDSTCPAFRSIAKRPRASNPVQRRLRRMTTLRWMRTMVCHSRTKRRYRLGGMPTAHALRLGSVISWVSRLVANIASKYSCRATSANVSLPLIIFVC